MMAQKPLLLKDYLKLDPNSDSSSSFSSFPRTIPVSTSVRFSLEAEQPFASQLIRSRSKRALTKISALINAVKNFPISSPTRPKKLSRRFWLKKKKKEKEGEECHKVTVKDIVRLNSFELYGQRTTSLYFPPPVVSSCSSCSDGDEGSESFSSSLSGSSEFFGDGRRNTLSLEKSPSRSQSCRQSLEEVESQPTECEVCQSEEEKEQLSPMSVMDFPYQEDEDDRDENEDEKDETSSPGFEQSLTNIERTAHQLLQKIRRFETLAELDLDPLDLEPTFAASEDEDDAHVAPSDEITAWDLIQRLRTNLQVGPHSENLLVDFFIEGLSWSAGTPSADVEGLLSAAGDWINGGGCLKAEEHGKAQLMEMERSGRWRCFECGRDDVAADVETGVLGSLMNELVLELVEMD